MLSSKFQRFHQTHATQNDRADHLCLTQRSFESLCRFLNDFFSLLFFWMSNRVEKWQFDPEWKVQIQWIRKFFVIIAAERSLFTKFLALEFGWLCWFLCENIRNAATRKIKPSWPKMKINRSFPDVCVSILFRHWKWVHFNFVCGWSNKLKIVNVLMAAWQIAERKFMRFFGWPENKK